MNAFDLGTIEYVDAWRLQEALASRLRAGGEESLLLLEHRHVFTIGRRGTLDHLTTPAKELRRLGARVYRVDRGGDITYHGPGQLVAYPIVDLARRGNDVVAYVRALESAVIAAVATLGVRARRVPERTGVWVDPPGRPPAKLAAIGVRVTRGVTMHGLALNVTTDLAWFRRMVPCGFAHEAASLASLGVATMVDAVKPLLARELGEALGVAIVDGRVPEPREDEIAPGAPVRSAADLLAELVPA